MPAIYNARFPNRIAPERLVLKPLPERGAATSPAPAPRPRDPAPPVYLFRSERPLVKAGLPPKMSWVKLDRLLQLVARQTGIDSGEIRGARRTKPVARARHLFWYVAQREFGTSLADLGRFLSKDHTSVMAGIRRAKSRLGSNDTDWLDDLQLINGALLEPPP